MKLATAWWGVGFLVLANLAAAVANQNDAWPGQELPARGQPQVSGPPVLLFDREPAPPVGECRRLAGSYSPGGAAALAARLRAGGRQALAQAGSAPGAPWYELRPMPWSHAQDAARERIRLMKAAGLEESDVPWTLTSERNGVALRLYRSQEIAVLREWQRRLAAQGVFTRLTESRRTRLGTVTLVFREDESVAESWYAQHSWPVDCPSGPD